jgi:hypothetical protein
MAEKGMDPHIWNKADRPEWPGFAPIIAAD